MDDNTILTPETGDFQPEIKPEPVNLDFMDRVALALAFALSALYFYVFELEKILMKLPGWGITAFVFVFYAVVFVCLGKKVHPTKGAIFLTASALLLALSCGLYHRFEMTIINCFVILGLSAIASFSLSGHLVRNWNDAGVLWEAPALACKALFKNFVLPFRAARVVRGQSLVLALLGISVAIPLLALVIALLCSADAVFDGLVRNMGSWTAQQNLGIVIWKALRWVVLALMLFSALYYIRHESKQDVKSTSETGELSFSSVPAAVVVALLDAVYVVFCAIQFAFLFGGAETAAMSGGYAEYARSGFFQLVAVAAINLCAVLSCASFFIPHASSNDGKKALQALSAMLLAATAVILVSAAWRMGLYISVYGFTFLRLLTIWGMLVVLVSLIAALLKLIKSEFKFFRVFFSYSIASWLVFSYIINYFYI